MLHKLLLTFMLGAIVMFGVLWFLPETLGYKRPNAAIFAPKTTVLGAETAIESDQVKSFVQTAINVVISHFAESEAAQPLVETTQSVQKAVTDVQSLPDNQKSAICREICAPTR